MIDTKDISVVVQGAIDKKLTPKCLKSIRKYLPNSEIILSTWEGSDVSGLDYDVLVENQDPGATIQDFNLLNQSRSINNFNRQLVSTQNGIKKATKPYILKLRSDLIFKNAFFLKFWNKFDKANLKYKIFKHRVLCSSIFSREYSCQLGKLYPILFHPSDFWFFGLKEDLNGYFEDCSLQTKEEAGNWPLKYPNRAPYDSALWRYTPEQQFCVNWVKKYHPNLEFDDWSDWNKDNIEFSNNILYNNFVFLGFKQSGIYSPKHARSESTIDLILGLITYEHFLVQYKNFCDPRFPIKKDCSKTVFKLKKHVSKLISPFKAIINWIFEIFSVLYYSLKLLFELSRRDK